MKAPNTVLIKKQQFSDILARLKAPQKHSSEELEVQLDQPESHQEIERLGELILSEAKSEAERILSEAQEKAAEILEEAELVKESAYKAAAEEVENLLKAQVENFENLIAKTSGELESLKDLKQSLVEKAQPSIIELALKLTEKIIARQVTLDPSILRDLLTEGIDTVRMGGDAQQKLILVISPSDKAQAQELASLYETKSEGKLSLTVKTDSQVVPGSCRVEGMSGLIDLDFSSQLKVYALLVNKQLNLTENKAEKEED